LPSIDVVNDEVKAITDTTLAERNTVNTRASFILGSGSIARKTRSIVIALAALIAEVVLLAITLIVVAAG
jgi:hypothetical protein